MKVRISEDEWYPVYDLDDDDGKPDYHSGFLIEAPEELVARHRAAKETFEAVQKELAALEESAPRLDQPVRDQGKPITPQMVSAAILQSGIGDVFMRNDTALSKLFKR